MTDMPLPPKPYRDFVERHPEGAEAYEQLGAAVREAGPLTPREVALVKLAIKADLDDYLDRLRAGFFVPHDAEL